MQVHPAAAGDIERTQEVVDPEPGGVDQDVGRVSGAVGGDHRAGLDVVDTAAHQFHVVATKCAKPAAVVLQGALSGGRVVGDHLGGQFLGVRVALELAGDPLGEHHPGHVIGLADRALLIRPRRVDLRRGQAGVAAGPEDEEAVPPAVERQMLQRPAGAGADGGVVVRVGEHPLRGALKDGECADGVGDRGGDLEPRRAGADHHHVLTRQVDIVIPAGGMERRSAEGLRARNVRDVGLIELAHRADHRAGPQCLCPIGIADGDRPFPCVVVPRGAEDFGAEPDVVGEIVAAHHIVEVGLQFGLAGEEFAPVVRRFEAVTVEVVANVDACAGIAVLPPGPADAGVLLDDGEGDAGLLEPDGGQQPGLTRADHDHGEVRAVVGL